MNAAELRIGNWISSYIFLDARPAHFGPKEIRKQKVTADDIKYIAENFMATYQGIELTHEILEKIGFKKIDSTTEHLKALCWYSFDWIVGYKSMGPDAPYGGFSIENISFGNSRRGGKELAYLHQLQNLYFALTGNELEINL